MRLDAARSGRHRRGVLRLVAVTALAFGALMPAAEVGAQRPRGEGRKGRGAPGEFRTSVPDHAGDIVLGRVTASSVGMTIVWKTSAELTLCWGAAPDQLTLGSRALQVRQGEPRLVVIDGLEPDRGYFYAIRDDAGAPVLPKSGYGWFHTARPRGQPFTFTITADSHLDEHADPAVYERSLLAARAAKPDFHVDLGDTFMTEKHPSRESALQQYRAQRYWLGELCDVAPLFLVLGNHDGENPRGRGGFDDALAVWSIGQRKRFFPNPIPDGFYTGNSARHPEAGLLEDYYAWEWGNALFVVLDPFWYTMAERGKGGGWQRSLGRAQYDWLKRTLESSRARFKFVFIHHLVGGLDDQCRGGAEAAPFYEWGGRNADGTDGFAVHRSGWPAPIHALLVANHVTAVFHGHDHLYAKQELDGIVYQEVPQPGYVGRSGVPQNAGAYGYKSGKVLGSPGFLRVSVNPDRAHVSFVRPDASVPDEYDLRPR